MLKIRYLKMLKHLEWNSNHNLAITIQSVQYGSKRIQYRTVVSKNLGKRYSKNFFNDMVKTSCYTFLYSPVFDKCGKLKALVFIILPDKGGIFGNCVKNIMFKHKEIYIVPSWSGKITKDLLKDWFCNIYFPNAESNSIFCSIP